LEKKKKEQVKEEQVNEEHPEVILSGFAVVQDHDESTGKKKKMSEFRKMMKKNDVKIQMIEEEYYSTLGWIPPPF
jgi:hypothetical protein